MREYLDSFAGEMRGIHQPFSDAQRRLPASRSGVRRPKADWETAYRRRLLITDFILIVVAVGGSHLFWFGFQNQLVNIQIERFGGLNYTITSTVLVLGWLIILKFYGTRDARVVGSGLAEYGRVADASFRLFGLLAIVALLLQAGVARGYIITAFPAGVLLLVASRWGWRQWLRRKRQAGKYLIRVLLVGSSDSVDHLTEEIRRRKYLGFDVVGACLSTDVTLGDSAPFPTVPVLGALSDIPAIVRERGIHSVGLAGSDGLTPSAVRRISWQLESTGVDLMVAPTITDVAGTRIHTRPVPGLPLIYVESPSYEAGAKVLKNTFDFTVALVVAIVFAPLMLIIALIVGLTSRGPVLYRQQRIGLNGRVFNIFKFRSMRHRADEELIDLLTKQGTHGTPLFKVEDDPRVTKVGQFLRKYSLDELPQIFNVLRGDMSLVGPRPQRAEEVALYDNTAVRRLLVKPGITGLWQVSGRSDLSWEDAVRLDLYYVENWSLIDDFLILLHTVRVVVQSTGAR